MFSIPLLFHYSFILECEFFAAFYDIKSTRYGKCSRKNQRTMQKRFEISVLVCRWQINWLDHFKLLERVTKQQFVLPHTFFLYTSKPWKLQKFKITSWKIGYYCQKEIAECIRHICFFFEFGCSPYELSIGKTWVPSCKHDFIAGLCNSEFIAALFNVTKCIGSWHPLSRLPAISKNIRYFQLISISIWSSR